MRFFEGVFRRDMFFIEFVMRSGFLDCVGY